MPNITPARDYPGGAKALLERVRGAKLMESLCDSDAELLASGSLVEFQPGEMMLHAGDRQTEFRVVLEGKLSVQRQSDECYIVYNDVESRECVGEGSLLSGHPARANVKAETRVLCISLPDDKFWQLMQQCPPLRYAVVGQFVTRFATMQTIAMERDKMATIGTLTAGLMHELNNPGAAARRATAQLRENLRLLQETAMRISATTQTPEQKQCVHELLVNMFNAEKKPLERNSMETMDREEAFCGWMDSNGVPNCWKIAPVLANSSLSMEELECARRALPPETLSDVLNWLEALGSSAEFLQTIETSMQRITDLVGAVKSYSWSAKMGQPVDFMDTMRAAYLLVKHKLITRNITVRKSYAPEPASINVPGIAQVWTNLLDNAADAVPETGGVILIRTFVADGKLTVEIEDNGKGIPEEALPHIFEPFYTTKALGKGTGLGLDIVSRTLRNAHGTIDVESAPGRTVFRVVLPLEEKAQNQNA